MYIHKSRWGWATKGSMELPLYFLCAQTLKPSAQVCSNVELLTSPHLVNQAPPGAQQLNLPVLGDVPHLEHPGVAEVLVLEEAGLMLIIIRLKTSIAQNLLLICLEITSMQTTMLYY